MPSPRPHLRLEVDVAGTQAPSQESVATAAAQAATQNQKLIDWV